MLKRLSSKKNLSKGLLTMFLLLVGASLVSYAQYGPYYSPDTVNYFDFSQHIYDESIWLGIYFPAYPFLLHCLALLPFLPLFQAAHLLIHIQYSLGIYFLYSLAKTIATNYRFERNNKIGLLLLFLIIYHSWWSFRIVTWAHADATFYSILLIWSYFLSQYYLKSKFKHLFIVSLLSAAMVWVKLNALSLIPFYAVLVITDKKREKWLPPLIATAASYFVYSYLFQFKLLSGIIFNSDWNFRLFSIESLEILTNNLGELLKTTLGFLLSDVVTSFIPHAIAVPSGSLLLIFLILIALKEIKKGLSLASLFLLFGLLYLLCLLAFQQIIGFEQFDFRPLFPYFLTCSGYGLIKLFQQNKLPITPIMAVALLISAHTIAGHVWLWKRTDVNSMFEVERLAESGMIKEVRLLHQELSPQAAFVSNHPEKLALLLNNPFITHYDPEFAFIHGKRRPIPEQQRQKNSAALMEKLLKGEAVAVIFGEDESLVHFAQENGVLVFKYAEGTLLLQPRAPVLH